MKLSRRHSLLAATALSLSACSGGGGGKSASSSSRAAPTPVSAPTTPTSSPLLSTVQNLIDLGTPRMWTYPAYNQYVPTGVVTAIQGGVTGSGVSIGILDTGADTSVQSLAGRVKWFNSYLALGDSTPDQNNIATANDPYGHGSIVTSLLGGATQGTYDNTQGPVNFFAGGVAPDAALYVAQTCDATGACMLYGKTYQDLMANGVHLFNQSMASNTSSYSTAAAAMQDSQQIGAVFASFGTGNLYVWAAGNDPKTAGDISVEAEVPAYTPSLQPQWLSAVNVDINSLGQVSGLDPTSNACGITAQWCLSAPGYDQVPIIPGTSFNTGFAVGTSFSAPIITGVAALVWQKYPWFTPANVTDTMLTTATHLGSGTGPNSTYGWGLVNAAAAVNGPAQFAFGDFAANVAAYKSTFSNPISGSGSLTLTGTTGTLTLAAANTYTGGTTVNSGNLDLTGSLAAAVTVNGGSFGGSGTVNGDVTNTGGTVISQGAIGGAPGLTINGGYYTNVNSTTAISIGTPLTVSGTASLAGKAEILAPPTSYTPQATETFINAGAITGTFASRSYGAGVFYTVGNFTYGPTTVTGTVTASNVAQVAAAMPGATKASTAGGVALQKSIVFAMAPANASTAGAQQFMKTAGQVLAARKIQQAQISLTSVTGEAYPTMRAISANEEMSVLDLTAQHAADAGLAQKTTTWFQYLGDFGTLRQKGADAVSYSSNGFLAGFETPVEGQITAGGSFAHLSYNGSLAGVGGRGDDALNAIDLYARYGGNTGFYGAVQIGYGWINGRVHRTIYTANSSMGAVGTTSDNTISEGGELGYKIDGINPFVSVADIRYQSGGLSETGGNGLGLSMPGQSTNYAFATAGVRASDYVFVGKHLVAVHGLIALRHKLAGSSVMNASFNGTPGASFQSIGQNLPTNEGIVGVNLAGIISGQWRWQVGWTGAYSGQGAVSDAVNAGVRVTF